MLAEQHEVAMKRIWTLRQLSWRLALVLTCIIAVVWDVISKLPEKEPAAAIEVEDPKPNLDQITIRTPTGTQVIKTKSISLETLRQEFFTEGKQHTKVTILHDPSGGFHA